MSDEVAAADMVGVLRRAREGIQAGVVQTSRELQRPDTSKGSRPWVVSLDMKDWIALARAQNGKEPATVPALDAVRGFVGEGRIIVPLSTANVVEVGKVKDKGQRERLAEFMVSLSRNHFFRYPDAVQGMELEAALGSRFAKAQSAPVRPRVLGWGVASAMLTSPVVLDEVGKSAPVSVFAMVNTYDAATGTVEQGMDEAWRHSAEALRTVRARSFDEQFAREANGALGTPKLRERILAAGSPLGIPASEIVSLLEDPQIAVEIAKGVPSLDILLSLRIWRDQNPQHRTHRNDLVDLLHLAAVVPYADWVVTDKAWAHAAVQSGVAKQYDTRVCRQVTQLASELARESPP
jgi:hypothetical protein